MKSIKFNQKNHNFNNHHKIHSQGNNYFDNKINYNDLIYIESPKTRYNKQ